jgi:hypothetical protein
MFFKEAHAFLRSHDLAPRPPPPSPSPASKLSLFLGFPCVDGLSTAIIHLTLRAQGQFLSFSLNTDGVRGRVSDPCRLSADLNDLILQDTGLFRTKMVK